MNQIQIITNAKKATKGDLLRCLDYSDAVRERASELLKLLDSMPMLLRSMLSDDAVQAVIQANFHANLLHEEFCRRLNENLIKESSCTP